MRNTFYLMREVIDHSIGNYALSGDLIIVPDEERAESVRASLRWFGHKTLRDIVELHPLTNADEARGMSVEVRTLTEMETFEFNERQAMEVL